MELTALLVLCLIAYWIFIRSTASTSTQLKHPPEQFIILDFETTGLSPVKNKIIEVGAIKVNRDSDNHESFSALIKISTKLPAKITEITGITQDMLNETGQPIEHVIPELVKFIGDLHIVAFNAKFDMSFLHAACDKLNIKVNNPSSCALEMAKRAWPNRKSYRLADIARDGNLKTQNHRAIDDCLLTLTIYTSAAAKLKSIG